MSDETSDSVGTLDPLDAESEGRPGSYRVQLDVFEGPLDLLLHLIKRNEVEIVDVPVAKITDQYIAYLNLMHDLSLDIAGEFLVMASTLTLIKSRMLLPTAEPDPEEGDEADSRADLVRQLLEYQRFREVAQQLGDRPLLNRDVFSREPTLEDVEPAENEVVRLRATVWDLLDAFRGVLQRALPDPVHEVIGEQVSLRERVASVLQLLNRTRTLEFESLFPEGATRIQIIATFLAVLELMRMQAVQAIQEQRFDRIVITLVVTDISTVSLDLADEYDGGKVEGEANGTHGAANGTDGAVGGDGGG